MDKYVILPFAGEDTKLELSSHRESANKENMNANRSEVPKLSVERQQMKKKKKGGGFNLRKSLAWDRAFFTEEGSLMFLIRFLMFYSEVVGLSRIQLVVVFCFRGFGSFRVVYDLWQCW